VSIQLPDSPLLGWGTPGDIEYNLPLNVHSNAYVASIFVKSGPGYLCGFTVYNSKTSSQFIQVFDAATLPADGAIPAVFFSVAQSADKGVDWIPARTFLTGCVICNSSTGPTKTIGSADCWFDVQFV